MGALSLILILFDDPSLRGLLARILEAEGYHIARAADGVQALAALATLRAGGGAARPGRPAGHCRTPGGDPRPLTARRGRGVGRVRPKDSRPAGAPP
jgi:CheY-like chemotaxis protein